VGLAALPPKLVLAGPADARGTSGRATRYARPTMSGGPRISERKRSMRSNGGSDEGSDSRWFYATKRETKSAPRIAPGKHFLPIVRHSGGCYDSTAQLRVTVSFDPCHRFGRRLKALEVAVDCKRCRGAESQMRFGTVFAAGMTFTRWGSGCRAPLCHDRLVSVRVGLTRPIRTELCYPTRAGHVRLGDFCRGNDRLDVGLTRR
jgi:hypothetical protein